VISKVLSFDWALWFFWIMATTLGWFLGGLVPSALPLVIPGFAVGVFQWLVLQERLPHPWRWIVATALGWTAGCLVVFLGTPPQFEAVNGAGIGLATGLAQWLILRREVQWSGWWIMFSIIGWTTGLTLFPGILLTGTLAGMLTGLALEILLRQPKPKSIHARVSPPDRLHPSGRNAP
jgi:hypothetical protein